MSQLASELFKRLKMPGLVGAIVAGALLGPNMLGMVTSTTGIELSAMLGAFLLLFIVGLEFEAESFWKVGRGAFLLTTSGVLLTLGLGYLAGIYLGWSPRVAFLLGAVMAPSGTSIIAELLRGKASSKIGSTLMTAAILDDVEGVILLSIALSLAQGEKGFEPFQALSAGLFVILFVSIALILGHKVLPELVTRGSKLMTDEAMFAVLLGLGMVLAYGGTKVGLAAATGAFIMGAVIPYRRIGERFTYRLFFMKEIFAAIFFTTVGMSISLGSLGQLLYPFLVILLTAFSGRLIGGVVGGLLGGLGNKIAVTSAVALTVRAEMSLIVAKQAVDAGIVGVELLVLASLLSLVSIAVVAISFPRMARGF